MHIATRYPLIENTAGQRPRSIASLWSRG